MFPLGQLYFARRDPAELAVAVRTALPAHSGGIQLRLTVEPDSDRRSPRGAGIGDGEPHMVLAVLRYCDTVFREIAVRSLRRLTGVDAQDLRTGSALAVLAGEQNLAAPVGAHIVLRLPPDLGTVFEAVGQLFIGTGPFHHVPPGGLKIRSDAVTCGRTDVVGGGQVEAVEIADEFPVRPARFGNPENHFMPAFGQLDRTGIDPAQHPVGMRQPVSAGFPAASRRIDLRQAVELDFDRRSPVGSRIGERSPHVVFAILRHFDLIFGEIAVGIRRRLAVV